MNSIYQDIARRTDGDIYIGVVGPVRTGKSTFIKKMMELLVIPNIENDYKRERTLDELPQSAAGKTIMTTEPKFVPNEAAEITLDDNTSCKVRLIDCVGYIVKSAAGYIENEAPRMVTTPWSSSPMPFTEAAEKGTRKVICDHSTIGIVVTTDGSITDIDRDDYIEPEERVVNELKAINKPFTIILNTINPYSKKSIELKEELEEKYAASVIPVNCMELNENDVERIMKEILYEFPLKEIRISLPKWITSLSDSFKLKNDFLKLIRDNVKENMKLSDISSYKNILSDFEYTEECILKEALPADGAAELIIKTPDNLFYKTVGELTGFNIDGQQSLMELLTQLSEIKERYDKISSALDEVQQKGYGIVSPTIDELTLEEPEIVKQGSRFGVKLKASAPSIHMIRADIETEVSPIVGTEKQSEELVHYLLNEFEVDPKKIWESNIFGKSLHELVNEGLHNKLCRMPDDAQMKLQETLQKIINEGTGGLICIIL